MNLMAPRQGWQCPVCQRVYAPMTHMCFYCPPKVTTSHNTGPLTGVVCGKCGADRLKEGCRNANPLQCMFAGEAL